MANQTPVEEGGKVAISDELGGEALDLLHSYSSVELEREKYYKGDRPALPSFKDNKEATGVALEYLAERPVGYDTQLFVGEDGEVYEDVTEFHLALGGEGVAGVDFYDMGGGKVELGTIRVDERLRKHGLGGRLMHSAVSLMKERGVTELYSGNLSRDGLRQRVAIFGADNLSFYYTDQHREDGRQGPAPVDVQEAVAVLDDIDATTPPEQRGYLSTFGVYTDLTKIDASAWERPVPAKVESTRVIYKTADQQQLIA